MRATVQGFEAVAGCAQSQSFFLLKTLLLKTDRITEPEAAVGYLQIKVAIVVGGSDSDFTALGTPGDAMFDRILHQRLEQQARHLGVERVGGDFEHNAEPVLKPHLLDFKITVYEFKL